MRNLGWHLITLLLLVLTISDQGNCGRILILTPSPSYSHQIVYHGLANALQKRGHEIVIVTSHPKRDSTLTNYTEIDFSEAYKCREAVDHIMPSFKTLSPIDVHYITDIIMEELMKAFYKNPDIVKLYNTDEGQKFDLVISEILIGYALMALAYKWNVPFIGVSSAPLASYHWHTIGNPMLPSHGSNWEFYATIGSNLSFWTKVKNYIMLLHMLYAAEYTMSKQTAIVRQALGDDIPPIMDVAKNMSLILAPFDPVIDDVMLLPPNFIPISGFHIEKEPPPLPADMAEFLGNANNGFVYMSLGSNMNSSMMSIPKVMELYDAFSRLPCRVLWKFETDYLSRRKGNVFTSSWIPQQRVLAHPNIKVFIFQGGLQSTEETVINGVPIVGIPVMFEQTYRIRRLVSLGAGRSLDVDHLDGKVFYETVLDVLTNESYKANMMELRKRKLDKPYDFLDHSVWWVEYVMRHKTVPHLRYSEMYKPWYQRDNVDIIAFLSVILFLITIVAAIILVKSIQLIQRFWSHCTVYMQDTSSVKLKKIE